jgi:ParB family transcriptional regulator, chromosome partitioning protein
MHEIQSIPWKSLKRSPLNPRRSSSDKGLAELAASIAEKGILQNLTARRNGKGYEIVMGARRHLAVGKLIEEGKAAKDYPLPVRVVEASDLELLQMATAENIDREDMPPLDEADAYAKMVSLGMTPEDIALKMGRSLGTVQKRLALSERLCDEARELLSAGELSLSEAQALIIGDQATQKALLARRENYYHGMDADDIRSFYRQGTIKVKDAVFDLSRYTGAYSAPDLFSDEDEFEPVFLDGEQAKRLQLEAIEKRAERLRQTWKFVHVLDRWKFNRHAWETHKKTDPETQGVLIVTDAYSLTIIEQIEGVMPRKQEGTSGSSLAERRALPEDAYTAKHLEHTKVLKAQAIQTAMVTGPTTIHIRKAVELAVYGMLGGEGVRIRLEQPGGVTTPAVQAVYDKHREALKAYAGSDSGQLRIASWRDKEGGIYRWLGTLSDADLEELFRALLASASGPHTVGNVRLEDEPLWLAVAADLGVDMSEHFTLDAEYLKLYKKPKLVEVAKAVGITVDVSSMTRAKLAEFILKHEAAKRYLPPELEFVGGVERGFDVGTDQDDVDEVDE